MKILFIADARSPIFKNWVEHFIRRDYDVHVISTFPCAPDVVPGVRVKQVPIAFSALSQVGHDGTFGSAKRHTVLTPMLSNLRSGAAGRWLKRTQHWVGPLELHRHVAGVRAYIKELEPDLVHAMRIPFEGIFATKATPANIPLLISVWGNDFTLHAKKASLTKLMTRQSMLRADALHCDCTRDLHLARELGFDLRKPSIVLPGSGGIQMDVFRSGAPDAGLRASLNIAEDAPVIINPRGFRGYVRNDCFFRSIPLVLKDKPATIFICLGMTGNSVAEKWVAEYGIEKNIRLLPSVSRSQMAELFKLADISVSPSTHDGTPNTLLEAIACGCFPVAGDIESVREWIDDKANGLLCDPADPQALAVAMLRALCDTDLREKARRINRGLILERAEYNAVMQRAETFYSEIVNTSRASRLRRLPQAS